MKILITGGNGYIGSSLYNNLLDEFDAIKICRSDFDLRNITSMLNFFENKYFDVIINCASIGGSRLKEDGWDVLINNVDIFYNLMHCSEHFGKLINFGSGASRYNFLTPYGLSKLVIEKTISTHPKFYNINIFAVFDENESDNRFIKTSIKNYINKNPMEIFVNKKMDFVYMPDFISIVKYYILNDNPPKEIDCTYPETKTLVDITNIINELGDYKVNVLRTGYSAPHYCENYHGEYSPINLNYIGIEQGIKNVYSFLIHEN
jgi:nucleoside-diphosphate-sugar epimerase